MEGSVVMTLSIAVYRSLTDQKQLILLWIVWKSKMVNL